MGFQNYVANEKRRVIKQSIHDYDMIKNFKSYRRKWRIKKAIILIIFAYLGFASLFSIDKAGILAFVPLGIAGWYAVKWDKQEKEMGDTLD